MVLRRLVKQLICGTCGDVIGEAAYRPWRASLVITAAQGGYQLQPSAAALQLQLAEQAAAGADGAERMALQRRADFIARHAADVMYPLNCPRGHQTVLTGPQIIAAMRRTAGSWVSLS